MKFSELSLAIRDIERTKKRLEITDRLAHIFSHASADEIGDIAYLLTGRVGPIYEAIEFGVADRFMARALCRAYGVSEVDVKHRFQKGGDYGVVAEELASEALDPGTNRISPVQPMLLGDPIHLKDLHPTVSAVFSVFRTLALHSGGGSQEQKIDTLARLFAMVDAVSARYIARIPLGKLRLGFSDMTILDGLSWMLSSDKANRVALEEVYNVRPDLAYIAVTIKTKGLAGLADTEPKIGAPIIPALCQRLPSTTEMIEKMGEVDAEPKYDGVRTQIHYRCGSMIQTFSRNLEDTSLMYPELGVLGNFINAESAIFDSEAVGFDTVSGKAVAFQETVTRKRKHAIDDARKTVTLKFFLFDILSLNGKSCMALPLSERRHILEQTVKPGGAIAVTDHIVTTDPEKLRDYHRRQIAAGLEGMVVKQWASPYVPGRRGFHWVKFKEQEGKTGKLSDTVDCVIMGYYRGEGKRSAFGIGALLVGVVAENKQIVSITKIGTGITDDQWKMLKTVLSRYRSKTTPDAYKPVHQNLVPDVWLRPEAVCEIAADDITRSPIHEAGFALRFPRFVRLREDKSPSQATTVGEIRSMHDMQSVR